MHKYNIGAIYVIALISLLATSCSKDNSVIPETLRPKQISSAKVGDLISASFDNGQTVFFKTLNGSRDLALCRNPSGKHYAKVLYIPDSIICKNVAYPVTEIADSACFNNHELTSVTFPKHIKIIGERAFAGTSIKTLVIPDKVEYLGDKAFVGCANLYAVHLKPLIPPKNNNTYSPVLFTASIIYVPSESYIAYRKTSYIIWGNALLIAE